MKMLALVLIVIGIVLMIVGYRGRMEQFTEAFKTVGAKPKGG